jgi:hypothetical protein
MKEAEALELVKFLNLESAESIEEAKEKFTQHWIKAEELSSKIGRVTGSITNVARKAFEPFGIVLTEEDFKDKKVEEVIRSASERAKESFETQKDEWEKRASGNGSETLIKEWESKYKSLEKKHNEVDSARQDVMAQFDKYKEKVKEESKINNINNIFEKELTAIKIDPSVSDITIRGFKSVIAEKYIFDIEEDGNAIVKDKKSGERLKSSAKAGSFLGINDILLKEATDAGIIQKNVHQGKPINQRGAYIPAIEPIQNNKVKSINPRFFGV